MTKMGIGVGQRQRRLARRMGMQRHASRNIRVYGGATARTQRSVTPRYGIPSKESDRTKRPGPPTIRRGGDRTKPGGGSQRRAKGRVVRGALNLMKGKERKRHLKYRSVMAGRK